jgi:hypothetical protein
MEKNILFDCLMMLCKSSEMNWPQTYTYRESCFNVGWMRSRFVCDNASLPLPTLGKSRGLGKVRKK